DTGRTTNTGQAAAEFVCGPTLVAFRTPETAAGVDLNGDGDTLDDVLQVWDLGRPECRATHPPADCLTNTRQAPIPCRLEACDPLVPYRVLEDTIRFLTLECGQGSTPLPGCPTGGTDLNGDGDGDDLVLQTFNVRQAAVGGEPGATLGAAAAGVCSLSRK